VDKKYNTRFLTPKYYFKYGESRRILLYWLSRLLTFFGYVIGTVSQIILDGGYPPPKKKPQHRALEQQVKKLVCWLTTADIAHHCETLAR